MRFKVTGNMCRMARMETVNEIEGLSFVVQNNQATAYAHVMVSSRIASRKSPTALMFRKRLGLDGDPQMTSITRDTVSSDGSDTLDLGSMSTARINIAETMFRFLGQKCLSCPLQETCMEREQIAKNANLLDDISIPL